MIDRGFHGTRQFPPSVYRGDIRDRELVSELVDEANVVVNFAAESHVNRSIDGADPFVSTNVGGTCALLDSATETGFNRFIQISADEVYGEVLDGKFSESDRLEPRNPYAATKAGADLLARSYSGIQAKAHRL